MTDGALAFGTMVVISYLSYIHNNVKGELKAIREQNRVMLENTLAIVVPRLETLRNGQEHLASELFKLEQRR